VGIIIIAATAALAMMTKGGSGWRPWTLASSHSIWFRLFIVGVFLAAWAAFTLVLMLPIHMIGRKLGWITENEE
jgi:hypothetical protein